MFFPYNRGIDKCHVHVMLRYFINHLQSLAFLRIHRKYMSAVIWYKKIMSRQCPDNSLKMFTVLSNTRKHEVSLKHFTWSVWNLRIQDIQRVQSGDEGRKVKQVVV